MIDDTDVAARLRGLRERIGAASARAGRSPSEVRLLGASKKQSVERLQAAWAAGLEIFAENRVQEAVSKRDALPAEADWHLIGPLQSNKARRAAEIFSTVHSIDRLKIARALDREAGRLGKDLLGFAEINLGAEESKHGFAADDLAEQLRPIADLEHLRLVGLMAIPPREIEPDRARAWFRRLRQLRDAIFARSEWMDRPGYLSMGMSGDFELAIEEGATHVRVGTALFGDRPPLSG